MALMSLSRFAILAAALSLLAGCLSPMADPGPDPARLRLHLKASLTPAQVEEAVRRDAFQPVGKVRFASSLGPNWRLDAWLVNDQGQRLNLPLAPGTSFDPPSGNSIDQEVVFLTPPGEQDLNLELWAEVNRSWEEQPAPDVMVPARQGGRDSYVAPDWQGRSHVVLVGQWPLRQRVKLAPGQEATLSLP